MQKWPKGATNAMTNRMKFAILGGVIAFTAAGGLLLSNRESSTADFEKALNRISGNWSGTAQLFLPDGKSPVLTGTCKLDGREREYRLVANFLPDAETAKMIQPNGERQEIVITKFLRLTPNGTYTLDEEPVKYDDLAGFAQGKRSNLRLVNPSKQSFEIVDFKATGSGLEISVATGKDKASVKPNVIFRMKKVQA